MFNQKPMELPTNKELLDWIKLLKKNVKKAKICLA